MKTILITGCSSGFGLELARYFLERDWSVVATMRTPREDVLPASERLRILPLDVTDAKSIAKAVEMAGPIDALVNNAGAGIVGVVEGVSMDAARGQFELNTIGTMAMCQAVLPGMREKGAGVIVNISSAVTLTPMPMLAAYTASKAAVNAFSENFALEVDRFGIRVHVVLPGSAPDTEFGSTVRENSQNSIPEAYASWAQQAFAQLQRAPDNITKVSDVTKAVWRAVTEPSAPFEIPAGADAVALAALKTAAQ